MLSDMENNDSAVGGSRHPRRTAPDADEAAGALAQLGGDRGRLAQRVVTPFWYYPAIGGLLAVVLACVSLAGRAPWTIVIMLTAVSGESALLSWFSRTRGIGAVWPRGAECIALFVVICTMLVAALGGIAWFTVTGKAVGWTLVIAVLTGAVYAVLGWRYDEALRRRIAAGR